MGRPSPFPVRLFDSLGELLPDCLGSWVVFDWRRGEYRTELSHEPPGCEGICRDLRGELDPAHPALDYLKDTGAVEERPAVEPGALRSPDQASVKQSLLRASGHSLQVSRMLRVMEGVCAEGVELSHRRKLSPGEREIAGLFLQHAALVREAGHGEPGPREQNGAAILDETDQKILRETGFTGREVEVLGWVSEGKRDKEIGMILGISERTVHQHLRNLFAKLGAETRTGALNAALTRVGKL